MTSIGQLVFYNCFNLASVVYLGSNDPIEAGATNIFDGCDQLRFVCVPSNYNTDSFCGLDQFCKHESCESFLNNLCYEPICGNNTIFWTRERKQGYGKAKVMNVMNTFV